MVTLVTGCSALEFSLSELRRDVKALLAQEHHRSGESEAARMISLCDLKLRVIAVRREGWYQFEFEDETNYGYRALVSGRYDEGPSSVSFKE